MTLIEVTVALTVAAMTFGGLLATLVQSRKLTENTIYRNSTLTIVQGYLEQIKAIEFRELPYYKSTGALVPAASSPGGAESNALYTKKGSGDDDDDTLFISPGTPPDVSSLTPGVVPDGAVDNLRIIDINGTDGSVVLNGNGEHVTMPDIPTDDLKMHVWVWINEVTSASTPLSSARQITLIYAWEYRMGGVTKNYLGSVRTIRSAVPTF